jgi:hypothetical protein
LSCGCRFDEDGPGEDDSDEDDPEEAGAEEVDARFVPLGVDGNGALTEVASVGGVQVIVHHGEVPASDLTMISGIRCTTALRTVIDLAAEVEPQHLEEMIFDCLDRRLFTVDEAHRRLSQPDMATHRGAERVRRVLRRQH